MSILIKPRKPLKLNNSRLRKLREASPEGSRVISYKNVLEDVRYAIGELALQPRMNPESVAEQVADYFNHSYSFYRDTTSEGIPLHNAIAAGLMLEYPEAAIAFYNEDY